MIVPSATRFGRLPPIRDRRTLQLGRYLGAATGEFPPAVDLLAQAGVTDHQVPSLFPCDGNSDLRDCTVVAAAHAVTLWSALAGAHCLPPASEVVSVYERLTGGRDTGLRELEVLKRWRAEGLFDHRILAFAELDASDLDAVRRALGLFDGLYVGIRVQAGAIRDWNAGVAWRPGPLTDYGHAAFVVGFDADGVTLLTWGRRQRATWPWWSCCVDAAFALIPEEARVAAFRPPGLDLPALETELARITAPRRRFACGALGALGRRLRRIRKPY